MLRRTNPETRGEGAADRGAPRAAGDARPRPALAEPPPPATGPDLRQSFPPLPRSAGGKSPSHSTVMGVATRTGPPATVSCTARPSVSTSRPAATASATTCSECRSPAASITSAGPEPVQHLDRQDEVDRCGVGAGVGLPGSRRSSAVTPRVPESRPHPGAAAHGGADPRLRQSVGAGTRRRATRNNRSQKGCIPRAWTFVHSGGAHRSGRERSRSVPSRGRTRPGPLPPPDR